LSSGRHAIRLRRIAVHNAAVSGPLGLVGSGEFTPATEAVDIALLEGREQRVVFLPTAAALEGAKRTSYWVELGRTHYRRLDIEATPLMVLDRAHADDAAIAAQVAGAGLIYMSGGDPTYLARTLVGSRVGDAIREAWLGGAAVAGCSAGAIALAESVPDIRRRGEPSVPGFGLARGMAVLPHFDRIDRWRPGATTWFVDHTPPGVHVIGIDEDTAMVDGPTNWRVMGRGSVWILDAPGERIQHGDGETFSIA
jgi:cyanophycinase-like exopeptidase